MPSGKVMLVILVIIAVAWTVWSWYVVRGLEKPTYTVIQEASGYEVRQYDSYIVAETVVQSEEYWDALNEGFRIIAGYIFGENASSTSIEMTVPVLTDMKEGQKIDMTSPVFTETTSATRTVAFVMPSEYTLETLPIPNDERVILREIPSRTLAVRTFSWYASKDRISTQGGKLRAALSQDGRMYEPNTIFAAYNPPLTIPFMRQYEVMVELSAE